MRVLKKSAFTLIEMVIAISLTALIFAYLYESVHNIDRSNVFYQDKIEAQEQKQALQLLIYNDILQSEANSSKVVIKEQERLFTFSLKSTHSIKNFFYPHISYIFYKKEQILFRLETILPISLPIREELIYQVPFNRFKDIEHFEIIPSTQKVGNFLIYYKSRGEKSLFEVKKI